MTSRIMQTVTDELDILRFVYLVARKSPDPSTQNGACLVNPKTGWISPVEVNRFPAGVRYTEDRWQRPKKYSFIEHAERNILYHCLWSNIATEGLVMYCPWAACADCARAIISARISEVVCHDLPQHKSSSAWTESIEYGLEMLSEAGVKLRYISGTIGTKIRFHGELIDI